MDLTTRYMGLNLRTPLVPAASPLSDKIDNVRRMEDAGASAVVLHSLFEEQLRREQEALQYHLEYGTESFAESLSYFPEPVEYRSGPDEYLEHIRKAKEAVKVPIIASLNGATAGGWVDYAKRIEQAGADALELNIYYIPTKMDQPGAEIEQNTLDILNAVKSVGSIPVALKLSPFYSNLANMAQRLLDKGLIRPPLYANLLLGSLGTIPATAGDLAYLIGGLPEGTIWAAAGIGRFQLRMNALAIAIGGHVRTGLEDSPYYDWRTRAPASNEQLVARVRRLAGTMQREIATPAEARRMLGLPSPERQSKAARGRVAQSAGTSAPPGGRSRAAGRMDV